MELDQNQMSAYSPTGLVFSIHRWQVAPELFFYPGLSAPDPSPEELSLVESLGSLQGETAGWPFLGGISPDGRYLVFVIFYPPSINIWDLERNRLDYAYLPSMPAGWNTNGNTNVWAFSSDSRFAGMVSYQEGSADRMLLVIHQQEPWPTISQRYLDFDDIDDAFAFTPDQQAAFLTHDHANGVWVLHLATPDDLNQESLVVLEGPATSAEQMAFTPDGRILVVATERQVILFDAQTGERLYSFNLNRPSLLLLSADGRLLITQNRVNVVEIWGVPNWP